MVVSGETGVPAGSPDQPEGGEGDTVLRAKYADFCSAQLTEVFMGLSDERIYQLVEEEARLQGLGKGDLGFKRMVQLATKRLRASVPLPDFDSWKEDYEAEPQRYDSYLMGLWEPLARKDEQGGGGE